MMRDSDLLTIKQYEDAVERSIETRYTLPGQIRAALCNDEFEPEAQLYVEFIKENRLLDFCDAVDDFRNNLLRSEEHNHISVATQIPKVFLNLGFHNLPLLITKKHLHRILEPKERPFEYSKRRKKQNHNHGLSECIVKEIPELLSSPVLITDDPYNEDAVLCILNKLDKDNYPIVLPLKPNGRGYLEIQPVYTNAILTIFGPDDYLEYFLTIKPNRVVWADSKGIDSLENMVGTSLFARLSHVPKNTIVKMPRCITNPSADQYAISQAVKEILETMAKDGKIVDKNTPIVQEYLKSPDTAI